MVLQGSEEKSRSGYVDSYTKCILLKIRSIEAAVSNLNYKF